MVSYLITIIRTTRLIAVSNPIWQSFVHKGNVLMSVNDKTVFVLWSPFIELGHLNCA